VQVPFPYDVGPSRNCRAVLGARPLAWLWPQPMAGDGLAFPVRGGGALLGRTRRTCTPIRTHSHLQGRG
jgi:hypothetical protein